MNDRRIARLQEQIKQRLAELLQRDVADPKLGFVTISRVELDAEEVVDLALVEVRRLVHAGRARQLRGGVVAADGDAQHVAAADRAEDVEHLDDPDLPREAEGRPSGRRRLQLEGVPVGRPVDP